VDVDCDVIAPECTTVAETIQTVKRDADIYCEVLEDDTGEDDCSGKLPSAVARDEVGALQAVKSHILAQENASHIF
jgi:hypothetical protein